MRPLILFILFWIALSPCFADEVILKNGKILKGDVISENEEMLILRDSSGVKLHIKKSNIDSIKPDEVIQKTEPIPHEPEPAVEPDKPKKKARVYKKEDLEDMPELTILGDDELPDEAALKNEFEDRSMREKEAEASWNEAALQIDDQIREAKEAYEYNKSFCDKVIPDLQDFPAGVPTGMTAEQYEERRRIACTQAEAAAKDLQKAQAEYEELLEDARKNGIPPGWVDPDRIRN